MSIPSKTESDDVVGTSAADTVFGGDGSQVLTGGGGADFLAGGKGNDTLIGSAGRDKLIGGLGNDMLVGGHGADILNGGPGADRFVYLKTTDSTLAAGGRDTIFDFSRAQRDKINLSELDANTKIDGIQAFKFIGSKEFTKAAGQLRYEKSGSDTFVYADVNGNGRADFAITLEGSIPLQSTDFLL